MVLLYTGIMYPLARHLVTKYKVHLILSAAWFWLDPLGSTPIIALYRPPYLQLQPVHNQALCWLVFLKLAKQIWQSLHKLQKMLHWQELQCKWESSALWINQWPVFKFKCPINKTRCKLKNYLWLPLLTPSFFNANWIQRRVVSRPWGYVCCRTLIVSIGWPTNVPAIPVYLNEGNKSWKLVVILSADNNDTTATSSEEIRPDVHSK